MAQYTISYKLHNNITYSCTYHVVWCVKSCRAVLVNGVEVRLEAIIRDVCTATRADLLTLDIMPGYVQLLVEVDPQYGIHRLVREMKGRSSHFLRREYPSIKSRLSTLWTSAYFVSTVGGAPPEVVQQYIETQKRA